MSEKIFSGIFPYLVTPLDESGHLKEDVLYDLVNHLISKGVHGLTPSGSTGEGVYLDWPTKKRVVEVVVAAAGGRVPIIAGVNSITTKGAVREAAEIERLGADGIIVVLPTYFPLNDQKQIVTHFRSVSRAVSCPVALYVNPNFAKWDFIIETLEPVLRHDNKKGCLVNIKAKEKEQWTRMRKFILTEILCLLKMQISRYLIGDFNTGMGYSKASGVTMERSSNYKNMFLDFFIPHNSSH